MQTRQFDPGGFGAATSVAVIAAGAESSVPDNRTKENGPLQRAVLILLVRCQASIAGKYIGNCGTMPPRND